jgi:O-antigen ligase
LVTIITCALLVRKRGDFVAGSLGLCIGVALLAIRGVTADAHGGEDIMEGANKNSYSLYALPALLLAGFICTRWKDVPKIIKLALIFCMLPTLAAIFMGGNRSGYVGAVLVGLMIFWDQRGRGMILVGAVALVVAVLIVQFGDTEVLDRRINQTIEGNKSDDLRVAIIQACAEIALENPLIGVSPQQLPFEIARKVESSNWNQLDSHNVFGHIAAGSGLICFTALIAAGWAMWTWGPGLRKIPKDDPLYAPRRLLRMMVLLWVIRGLFTREVLYNPSFCIALGLVIGLCILAESARSKQKQRPIEYPSHVPGMTV